MTENQTIESLFESYKTAVFNKDLAAFTHLFDENVRVFDLWERWSYEGLTDWSSMPRSWFSSMGEKCDAVTFDQIQIHQIGDMALATAFVRFTELSATGEELRYLENRLTWVAQKKEGAWKIIHQHTSSPVESASLKTKFARI